MRSCGSLSSSASLPPSACVSGPPLSPNGLPTVWRAPWIILGPGKTRVLRLHLSLLYWGERPNWGLVLTEEARADSFTEFVTEYETRLRQSLTAAFGVERGKDAAAESLAYGWEHWDRISVMENPAGYLYRVGYDRARRASKERTIRLPSVDAERQPWVEPGLPDAFASLAGQQRIVVALLHGYQWSMSEVAEHLGITKASVQTHDQRGLNRLRRKLGVEL